MYDPKAGRWLSEDPTDFEAGDVNLYRYVGNSPTNATDPSGHAKKPSGSVEPEEALVHATEDRVGYYVGFFAS